MLIETKATLGRLKLHGLMKTLDLRLTEASQNGWGYNEVLAALLSDEENYRRQKKTLSKIRRARFRIEAHFDHFDYGAKRELKPAQIKELQGLNFLKMQQNLILLGPTGVGKTFLATAIGHEACKEGYTVIFMGVNLFIEKTALARASGNWLRLRDQLSKCDLLILDDIGIKPLPAMAIQDLYDVLEERYQSKSTLITSQLPTSNWKEVIEDRVALEAILDRLIYGNTLTIDGDSYRKKRGIDKAKGTSENC